MEKACFFVDCLVDRVIAALHKIDSVLAEPERLIFISVQYDLGAHPASWGGPARGEVLGYEVDTLHLIL